MKKQHQERNVIVAMHLWTYPEAVGGLAYIRAVVRSVRESWLEMQSARLRVRRLDALPGRPDRRALILRVTAGQQVESAKAHFNEALRELLRINVYSIDPVQGLALIPFARERKLAWLVFDLHAPKGLDAWRFHTDPVETRRPLDEGSDSRLPLSLSV